MEASPPETKTESQDPNPKPQEEKDNGLFSRPDYAKKDFWNGRFEKFLLFSYKK